MSDPVSDFLNGGGVPAAKFQNPGDEVKGTILSKEMAQQTEFGTGNLKTYRDGNPMMQAVITLQTENHEDDDDGRRRLYVAKTRMRTAISEAIRSAGASELEIGGQLAVKFTGMGKGTGAVPPKLWAAYYKPAPEGYEPPQVQETVDKLAATFGFSDEPF